MACGKYLAQRTGHNFEIKVGDAVEFMRGKISEGVKYDYVFTDLTDMPVSNSGDSGGDSDLWAFLCLVAELAVNLIKPNGGGKLMAHCNRKTLPEFIVKFEGMLAGLRVTTAGNNEGENGHISTELKPVFQRRDSFVPSFMGTWVFYTLQMTAEA